MEKVGLKDRIYIEINMYNLLGRANKFEMAANIKGKLKLKEEMSDQIKNKLLQEVAKFSKNVETVLSKEK